MLVQGGASVQGARRRSHGHRALLATLMGLLALTPAGAAPACADGPALQVEPLGAGLWLLPAATGEASAANRGFVSNLLVARHQGRLWLLGSGPSPAFGRRLACQLHRHFGQPVSELIDPWARAELVLGNAGLPAARVWAHRQVAQAMREQCAHCVERLAARLEAAAADLGDDPVRLPERLLEGEQGRLGPFDWWLLPRATDRVVTVWRHRAAGVSVAHGLLWTDGPPDGRDADLALMAASTRRLAALAPPADRWVGEQGPIGPAAAVQRQADYWQAVQAAARAGVERGDLAGAAPPLPDLPPGWAADPRHLLNWQRAWRQAEDALLRPPAR